MSTDRPCIYDCGRWATPLTDACRVCGSNKSVHKRHRPAQRMAYRQKLALANRRQTSYAEEFGDPKEIKPFDLEEAPKKKAEVIRIGPHLKRRRTNSNKRRHA